VHGVALWLGVIYVLSCCVQWVLQGHTPACGDHVGWCLHGAGRSKGQAWAVAGKWSMLHTCAANAAAGGYGLGPLLGAGSPRRGLGARPP